MGGRLGKRLLRQLHRQMPVIGLGRREATDLPSDVQHHSINPLRSGARQIFRCSDIGAVVHLGIAHDPKLDEAQRHQDNLLSFQRVLAFAEQFDIPKVILLSSANTYGPRPENAQFLTEDAPLLASGRFTEMRSLVELDMFAQSFFWRCPQMELVILRPANVLGTVRNAPSNYLRLSVIPTLMGFDPMVQAVHQDDVVSAITLALASGVRGIFNVAGPPPVPLSRAIALLGRRRMAIPHTLAKRGVSGLFRMGMTDFPAPELDFIRFVCMVDDARARSVLGYRPTHGLTETLSSVDEERWA